VPAPPLWAIFIPCLRHCFEDRQNKRFAKTQCRRHGT
jgi:hypothetical protein